MARIFSISFHYGGMEHNAMVTVRNTPFFTEYSINIFDDELHELLPNNKVISTSATSFTFSDSTSENAPQLMNSIIKAIAGHIHTLQT